MAKLKDLPAGDILKEQAIMPHSDTTVAKQAVVSQGKFTKKVHRESKTSYAITHYPFVAENLEIPSSNDEGFPNELCTYWESLKTDSNEAQLIGTLTHMATYAWEWASKARQTQDWLQQLIKEERWQNTAVAESLAKMGIQIEVVDNMTAQITNRGLSYSARVRLNTDILRDICAILKHSFGIDIIDTKKEKCKTGEFHPIRWNAPKSTFQKAQNVNNVTDKHLKDSGNFMAKTMSESKMF
jgi:hypothetical protein